MRPLTAEEARASAAGLFDATNLRTLTGNDLTLQLRLVEEILRSCHLDRTALMALHDERRAPLLHLSHRILGAARMVGATGVVRACEALEAAALGTAPQHLAGRRAAVIEQLQVLERVMRSVQKQIAGKKKPPA